MQDQRTVVRPGPGTAMLALLFAMAGPAGAAKAPPVALTTAETRPIIRELSLTGSLSSPQWARIAPEVAGRVTDIATEAGDSVRAGDKLLQLDSELGRIDLRQAEAAKREAEAELANARRRLREAERLAERESIAQTDLEGRRSEVQRLEAVLARRQAEQAFQAALVARHTLKAPFAGVINRRMIDLGERADPAEPVFELVATDHLWLDLEVPQGSFGEVSEGTPVRIRFDAMPDQLREETVTRVIPVSADSSRTFRARIDLDNRDRRLIPGMSARATLRIETDREGVVIPQDGLLRYPDGRTVVWIAEGDGDERTVREQRVRTGLKFDGSIAILDGLEPGTQIVTEGNEALQDGQTVRVARVE